jgi:hypothetical protein
LVLDFGISSFLVSRIDHGDETRAEAYSSFSQWLQGKRSR